MGTLPVNIKIANHDTLETPLCEIESINLFITVYWKNFTEQDINLKCENYGIQDQSNYFLDIEDQVMIIENIE